MRSVRSLADKMDKLGFQMRTQQGYKDTTVVCFHRYMTAGKTLTPLQLVLKLYWLTETEDREVTVKEEDYRACSQQMM